MNIGKLVSRIETS